MNPSLLLAVFVSSLVMSSGCPSRIVRPDAPPAAPPKQACEVITDEDTGDVLVAGRQSGVQLEQDWLWKHIPEIAVFPLDEDRVLFSTAPEWMRQGGASPDGVLWVASCKDGKATPFMEQSGADFGAAALTPDGKTLYYTGPRGVEALDLAARTRVQVTETPRLDPETCWAVSGDEESDRVATDIVSGLSSDGKTLYVLRGGPCGYESDFSAEELWISNPSTPGSQHIDRPHPIASIAADADGELWLGDAGACAEPGVSEPQSPGLVWTSTDQGDTWVPVKVSVSADEGMQNAAAVVLADAARPGHVLVLSGRCSNEAMGEHGGNLFVTRDAGVTWERVPMPAGIEQEELGALLSAADLVDGSVDHIRIWWADQVLETEDAGATWTDPPGAPAMPEPHRTLRADGWTFRATENGLWRTGGVPEQETRVFPQAD